jgi:hypothetical protein
MINQSINPSTDRGWVGRVVCGVIIRGRSAAVRGAAIGGGERRELSG